MRKLPSKSVLSLVLASLLVTGCGSGGSEEEGAEVPNTNDPVANETPVTVEPIVEEPVVQTPEITTFDLVASEDFELNSTGSLDLDVYIPALSDTRAYLNVCHEKDDGRADYSNCLLNTPLKNGELASRLTLGNDVGSLVMEVWRYDTQAEPFVYHWQREDGLSWGVYP